MHPTAQDLARYRAWQREAAMEGRRLARLANAPTRTRDGIDVRLLANAESSTDVAMARSRGADGIGLYRTEFLFLRHKGLPSEDEQFIAYRDVVLGMGGAPVTIRTLDLGADKADAAGLVIRGEDNPALGVRGVRLSLRHPAVFTTQIRAILRAACYGPVRVLVPMVTQPDELIAVRTLFKLARQELKRENVDLPEKLALGAMIEVPAAAINVRALLEHADFLAIGTNDLAQYVLAADRGNDALENIYNPLQPALLRLLSHVIAAGRRARQAGEPVRRNRRRCQFHRAAAGAGPVRIQHAPEPDSARARSPRHARPRHVCAAHAPRLIRARTHEEAEALLANITGCEN